MNNIRNFSIIAHIDHGKSTLADRIIQLCGGLSDREMEAQVLDSMDLERERGITIKAQTAALTYKARDGQVYNLNLIDTPGHVDFSAMKVSRSLSACEGALLVVDASQGVEAQTVANCYTAIELGVEVVPVLNKIDLPSADPENAIAEIEDVIGIDAPTPCIARPRPAWACKTCWKSLIAKVPPPKGDPDAPLQALIIDSWFDNYVGVVMLVRVVNGTLRPKDKIQLMATGAQHLTESVGVFTPKSQSRETLSAGQVGFIIAGIKELKAAKVGDTVTLVRRSGAAAAAGLQGSASRRCSPACIPVEAESVRRAARFAGKTEAQRRRRCMYEPEVSQALGFGFRCGFLGLLHMEIVQERLEREFDQDLITTAPTVVYEVVLRDGTCSMVENPSKMPDPSKIEEMREPIVTVNLYMPQEYVGSVITLCTQKRGVQIDMSTTARQVS